jgi:hypothetical protein
VVQAQPDGIAQFVEFLEQTTQRTRQESFFAHDVKISFIRVLGLFN